MANLIYGHVGYGIILVDEGLSESLSNLGPQWEEALKRLLYPEGFTGLEITSHFIRGNGEHDAHLLLIEEKVGTRRFAYGITDSASGPDDLSGFLETLAEFKLEWDARIEEFVRRCQQHGIELFETRPHPMLYLSWNDGIHGRNSKQ